MNQNELNSYQKYNYDKEEKKNQDKFSRVLEKYLQAVKDEEKYASNVAIAPKSALLQYVDFVYVVFKNNESPKKVLKLIQQEPTVSVLCRRCLFLDDEIKDKLELDEQYLCVHETVEPD